MKKQFTMVLLAAISAGIMFLFRNHNKSQEESTSHHNRQEQSSGRQHREREPETHQTSSGEVQQDDLLPEKTLKHIFEGEVNSKGKAVGCHHVAAIQSGNARIVKVIHNQDAHGVYEAEVEIYDAKKDRWIHKDGRSTFFPDKWSKEKVVQEIKSAYNSPQKEEKGPRWTSTSPSGVRISGYTNQQGQISTAYPLYDNVH